MLTIVERVKPVTEIDGWGKSSIRQESIVEVG